MNLEEVGGPDAFVEAVRRNLADGTFVYAVVARTLPPALGTVLRYLSTIAPAPRRPGGTANGAAGSSSRTTPEQFLEAVGPASAFWDGFIQYLDGLPGKFFWGSKGFSYRLVYEGKQYPVIWGYPRTVWWLPGRKRGDELRVLVRAEPDWPDALRSRVTECAGGLLALPGAEEQAEGARKLAVLYVSQALPTDVEPAIRRVLQSLFTPAAAT